MIVNSMQDLSKIVKGKGRLGMFALHSVMHDGHRACARETRKYCDFLIGMYNPDFAKQITRLYGEAHETDKPFSQNVVDDMLEYADVVLLYDFDFPIAVPYLSGLPEWSKGLDLLFRNPLTTVINMKYHINSYLPAPY